MSRKRGEREGEKGEGEREHSLAPNLSTID